MKKVYVIFVILFFAVIVVIGLFSNIDDQLVIVTDYPASEIEVDSTIELGKIYQSSIYQIPYQDTYVTIETPRDDLNDDEIARVVFFSTHDELPNAISIVVKETTLNAWVDELQNDNVTLSKRGIVIQGREWLEIIISQEEPNSHEDILLLSKMEGERVVGLISGYKMRGRINENIQFIWPMAAGFKEINN